jgi:hypothetical protein
VVKFREPRPPTGSQPGTRVRVRVKVGIRVRVGVRAKDYILIISYHIHITISPALYPLPQHCSAIEQQALDPFKISLNNTAK